MKRITTIVLFAGIFAVAVGTLGLSGNSATTLMTSAVPQSQEGVGILGHVEYKVLDDMGNIKAYMQNDNIVVESGKDCASQDLFTPSTGIQVGDCIRGNGAFTYIGIGNGTVANGGGPTPNLGAGNQTLADSADNAIGFCSTVAGGGDMARRNVTASVDASGLNTIITLETSGANEPFTFDATNNTSVIDSGIFNADYDTPVTGHICNDAVQQDAGVAGVGDWNMFSRQLLNGETGIAVTTGDSLSVKWTITVG